MALRLFHITEFAQSLLTPADQREAHHPALLLLLASFWLAVTGCLPLWRELTGLPISAGSVIWLTISFGLLTMGLIGVLLTLLNWPGMLRPFIILLLWLSALNSLLLWTGDGYLRFSLQSAVWRPILMQLHALSYWQLGLALGLLALVPTIWLMNQRVRRVGVAHRLPQNIILLLMFTCLLGVVWFISHEDVLPLLHEQSRWLELISPWNTLLSLRH